MALSPRVGLCPVDADDQSPSAHRLREPRTGSAAARAGPAHALKVKVTDLHGGPSAGLPSRVCALLPQGSNTHILIPKTHLILQDSCTNKPHLPPTSSPSLTHPNHRCGDGTALGRGEPLSAPVLTQRLLTVQTADSLLGGKVEGQARTWVGVTGAGRTASSCVRPRGIPTLRAPAPQGTRAWESGPSGWEGTEEGPSQGRWEETVGARLLPSSPQVSSSTESQLLP